jgi:hypothetical protein
MKKIIDICLSEDDDEDQVRHVLEIWSVKATRRQPVASKGEAEFLFGKRIEAEVKRREDIFSFYTWVFSTFGEGICGKSPFIKCGSFLKCAFHKPQFFLIKAPI